MKNIKELFKDKKFLECFFVSIFSFLILLFCSSLLLTFPLFISDNGYDKLEGFGKGLASAFAFCFISDSFIHLFHITFLGIVEILKYINDKSGK